MFDVRVFFRSALDVRRSMFDVRVFFRSALDVRRWTFGVGRSALDVRRWMFDVRISLPLGVGCSMFANFQTKHE